MSEILTMAALDLLTLGWKWAMRFPQISRIRHGQHYELSFGLLAVFVREDVDTGKWLGGVLIDNTYTNYVEDGESAVETARETLRLVIRGIRALLVLEQGGVNP